MNWGWKLAIGSALFMAMIIYFVVQSFNNKTMLVSDNYYEEELKFQEQIDAQKNVAALNDPLVVSQKGAQIIIDYPTFFSNHVCTGTIHFYKPSNENHDVKIKFSQTDGKQFIPVEKIIPGRYQVKIDLAADGKTFYYEKPLSVQ